jgi:hypothetical protein
VTRSYGHLAYVDAHGIGGGLKRLVLGNYVKIDQAKQACERHYRGGCDLSNAERIREEPSKTAAKNEDFELGSSCLSAHQKMVADHQGQSSHTKETWNNLSEKLEALGD